jgi:hypothetical protein
MHLSLFPNGTNDAPAPLSPEKMTVEAVVARAKATMRHEWGRSREDRYANALEKAAATDKKRSSLPAEITAGIAAARVAAHVANERIWSLCASEKELASAASGSDLGNDDNLDEDDVEDDAEDLEDEEFAENDLEEEDDDAAVTAIDEATLEEEATCFWAIRRAAAADELAARAVPSYNRLAALEAAFLDRYGQASWAMRDILVAIEMHDGDEWDHLVDVNGIIMREGEDMAHLLDDGDDLARALIVAIAAERTKQGVGAPSGVVVAPVKKTDEIMPRLDDGVPRPYFRCPCCGGRWKRRHQCFSRHACERERYIIDRSGHTRAYCVYEGKRGGRVGYSIMARTRHGILFVSPTFVSDRIARDVERRFGRHSRLRATVTEAGITVEEALPPLPVEGTVVDEFLEVQAARRIPLSSTIRFQSWWMHGYDTASKLQPNERTIRYATAVDVIAYRSRARTTPTIIDGGGRYDDLPTLTAAVVGDRRYSVFGPRVTEVIVHEKRPKAGKDERGRLRELVKDGNVWKTIVWTVDPIESFDPNALTQAVLEKLENDRFASPRAAALVREMGAVAALRHVQANVEKYDLGDYGRYKDGYEDAVYSVVETVRHGFRCPDCGVYDDCHDGPVPCGDTTRRQRDAATASSTAIAETADSHQLGFALT